MSGVLATSNGEDDRNVPVYESITRNIISNPLEDGLVPQFLTNINMYIDRHLIPSTKHIQVLLYLAVNPEKHYDPFGQCTPISLLSKLVLTYGPAAIKSSLPSPLDTKTDWVAENPIERKTWSRMKACEQDGIFDLLWIPPPPAQAASRKRRRTGEGEVMEVEKPTRARKRVVSLDAWELLEWLLDVWNEDRPHVKDQGGDTAMDAISPMFIAQLQSDPTLKVDDLTCPCAIIPSIYANSINGPEAFSALHPLISKLLSLIVPLLRSPSRFDLTSFTRGFLPILRLSSSHLELFLPTFQAASDPAMTAHLITVLLESIACTRRAREKLRWERLAAKANVNPPKQGPDLLHDAGYGILAPPGIPYLLHDLLLLQPVTLTATPTKSQQAIDRQLRQDKRKMGVLKLELVKSMISVIVPSEDSAWAEINVLGAEWVENARNAMDKQSWETLSRILDGIKVDLVEIQSDHFDEL